MGLVTADQFREIGAQIEQKRVQLQKEQEEKEEQLAQKKKELRENKRRKMQATLSFVDEENGEDGVEEALPVEAAPKKRVTKDPTAQTDFLPDREREMQLAAEKERLTQEWLQQQEIIKGMFPSLVSGYVATMAGRLNLRRCLRGKQRKCSR